MNLSQFCHIPSRLSSRLSRCSVSLEQYRYYMYKHFKFAFLKCKLKQRQDILMRKKRQTHRGEKKNQTYFIFFNYLLSAVICGPLIPPTNVTISPSSCLTSSRYNQTCIFSCQTSRYVLIGCSSRVCSNDGSWTGSNNARCRRKLMLQVETKRNKAKMETKKGNES